MRSTRLGFASALLFVSCAQTGSDMSETTGSQPIPMAAADLEWVDLDPTGAPGVKIAKLWGDPTNGPFGAFFLLPAGFAAALHTHTHAMKLIIVSGTYVQQPDGAPAFRLGRGHISCNRAATTGTLQVANPARIACSS